MSHSRFSERDRAAILFANDAFYAAFAAGDWDAMQVIWADHDEIACLHPGWEPLIGQEEVMLAWEALLEAPPPVRPVGGHVIGSGDFATVICFEYIEEQYLIATNVFERSEEGTAPQAWRMVHHQAGMTRAVPEEDETDSNAPAGSQLN